MFSKAGLAVIAAAISMVEAGHNARTHGVAMFWQTPLVTGRMDPIIFPGAKTSQHVHTVMGGDGFSVFMDNNAAANSHCTGSLVKADKSNYWFPQLYFQDPKTKAFESVNLNSLRAYYFFEATDDDIKPFPKGFRMVSGNPFARSNYYKTPFADHTAYDRGAEIQPISWSCGRTDGKLAYPNPLVARPGGSTQGPGFPKIKCDQIGAPLASYIHFPSCADLSKPFTQFANNTVWPTIVYGPNGSQKQNCPKGYTHLPHIFFEIKWSTPDFANRWTEGDGQPFVLAQGDKTGFGGHADFISGWDEDALQHIINTCDSGAHGDGIDSCPGVANFNAAGSHPKTCTIPPSVPEQVTGKLNKLPGCNPIQNGPQNAMICDCSGSQPVCNIPAPPIGSGGGQGSGGSGTGSGSGSGSGSSTSKAPAPTKPIQAPSPTKPTQAPSPTSKTSAAPPKNTHDSGDSGKNGSGSNNNDDGDDGEDDDEDDGDDGCQVPTPTTLVHKSKPTPQPMYRRFNHRRFHQRS